MLPAPREDEAELQRLLAAVTEEVHLLAVEITALGDVLSGESQGGGSPHLQTFDLLGQRAFASARLLRAIERGLCGDLSAIAPAVEAMPFAEIRERLGGGRAKSEAGADIEWF